MEKVPDFIKKFSKEESVEERLQTARAIKTKRAEHFTDEKIKIERQRELQQSTEAREQSIAEQLEVISGLENEIEKLAALGFGKILNFLKLKKLRADVAIGKRTYEELKQQQDTDVAEDGIISEKLESEEMPVEIQEAKVMLDTFYIEQKEKWAKSEYTKEDIVKYFSEENLASLSLDDYSLLLKRFPREMVTHVTRQGLRDHVGHMYHTGGIDEYADGFIRMTNDGRLRSVLGVHLIEKEKERAIARFLHLDDYEDEEKARTHLDVLTAEAQGQPGSYVDKIAVHFATEQVADTFYGSERGNEIFIAYPSAYIASQYYFRGQLNRDDNSYWNDQWVWANEERGMDLNAGLVFISGEAKVDKKTGSRYELDEKKSPVKNAEYHIALRRVVDSPGFHDFAKQVMEISGKFSQNLDDEMFGELKNRKLFEKLEPFLNKLEQEFGIRDRRLIYAIIDYHMLQSLDYAKKTEELGKVDPTGSVDDCIDTALREYGILFAEAKDTISSKEFWEEYFKKNLAKKPSKIIYYKGVDPTKALRDWQIENAIYKGAKDENVGFSEKNVDASMPQATVGLERFRTLAEKVIEDYYAQKKEAST